MASGTPRRLLLASQPLDGGVPHHVLDLVRSLEPGRFQIELACPRESILWDELEGSDVVLHRISARREPGPPDVGTLARLLPLVRRADVIHGHSAKAGYVVRMAAAMTGRTRSCVFTPHGWSFWSADGRKADLYRALERGADRWCRTIVALSQDEREAGLAAGVGVPGQYAVIPNGIELGRFALAPEPVPGRVLVVGRFAPPKRPDLILRAFADVRAAFAEAELWFVGDGPDRADAERISRELGVDDSTRFLGARRNVPELLASSACFVLASDYEGCPISVIEAMAAAVPVVATDVGGVAEVVRDGETGYVVAAGRPEGIAHALTRVLGDPARSRDLGAAGRSRAAAEFSRVRMAAETTRIYDEIARASGT